MLKSILRISRARRIIENTFGILCTKWRLLLHTIETSTENTIAIVKAILCLHNFLLVESNSRHNPLGMVDKEGAGHEEVNGTWRNEILTPLPQAKMRRDRSSRSKKEADEMRNKLVTFFNGVGSVSWQDSMVELKK